MSLWLPDIYIFQTNQIWIFMNGNLAHLSLHNISTFPQIPNLEWTSNLLVLYTHRERSLLVNGPSSFFLILLFKVSRRVLLNQNSLSTWIHTIFDHRDQIPLSCYSCWHLQFESFSGGGWGFQEGGGRVEEGIIMETHWVAERKGGSSTDRKRPVVEGVLC